MAKPVWLEVSMVVDGELAEAVADVIGRYTPQGVVMEQAVKFNDEEDLGTPYGPIKVFGYIPMDSKTEQKRQHLEESLWHLGQIQALPALEYKHIEDQDWMTAWKKFYKPIPIGEKLLILPAWMQSEYPDRIAIRIDPSMAFGTGSHPSTQLVLALIEKYIKPGDTVIDVGCGTGILSIATLLLGAKLALGVDIDPISVTQTIENAKANGVEDRIVSEKGSVAEVLAGGFALSTANLVLANILAPVITRLFDADNMADLVEKGGIILLAGIMNDQAASVDAAARRHGLTPLDSITIGDWTGLAYRK
ncbi:MAG TPA: 50S ribosomal protein L11 methyltransferase [Bellilinea sp.]|nr:50S ribosomal protein L11 methyltransferase [Bellilinea sp.]